MGLFEKIFGRFGQTKKAMNTFQTLTAYAPAFSTWKGAIYEAEMVRAAVDAKARHIGKLTPVFTGSAKPGLQARLRVVPNPWQTWYQWLYRTVSILEVENNAFLVPVLDGMGETVGIYTVLPSMCEMVEYEDELYLRYTFRNGKRGAIEFGRCGILTRHQCQDDFFGSSNAALNPTMEVINAQNEAIKEGTKSAATFRFMARKSNFADEEDLVKEQKRFTEANFSSESGGGVLLFPNTYTDVRQIDSKPFTVDAAQMAHIRTNVQNYFGVSEKIMQNSANDDEMDAFFNGAIEPFSIQVSEVISRMLFSPRELSVGNRFILAANRLQYMNVAHKINLATQLGDRGMILIDEIRELFNYPPLPDGAGQRAPIRGEYYFAGEKAEEKAEVIKKPGQAEEEREADDAED